MFAIRPGILHLIWVQSISVLREYKDTLQDFHLKDHISKIVDIDILYIYLQTIRNCWVKPILNIMVQAAFGPFFVTVPGHWTPASRWRKKSHTGDRYHIEKATMNFFLKIISPGIEWVSMILYWLAEWCDRAWEARAELMGLDNTEIIFHLIMS